MTAAQVIELVIVAAGEIAKLVQAGFSHDEALRRVRLIGAAARQIDKDVDEAGK